MAPVAFHLDHQFWVFACHCQITDTIKFSTNYMLIQQPNGRAPLIKVEEHSEDSNFSIGAKVRICTEYAENGLQVGHSNARHVLDEMTSWRPCTRARPTIAELCCRVATAWPQLADTRPSTLRAGMRYQWRRAAQFSRSHSLTPSPALALASAAEPPWPSWPPPRPPASGLPHVHPCAPPAPPPSS